LEPKQILTTIKILIKANELEASWQLTPFQILFLLSNFIKKKKNKEKGKRNQVIINKGATYAVPARPWERQCGHHTCYSL
jgi:hypothetical protein